MKDTNNPANIFTFFRDRLFWQPALAALLLGLSRYPLKLNFLAFFAFLPLLFLLQQASSLRLKKIVKIALSFSTVYTLVALYWISVVTLPGFIGLFILFGFYFILLFFVVGRIYKVLPRLRFVGLITCWLSFEWLQNFGELRFPWFNLGYSLADYTSLIQISEIGGIYLLSLLILIINILLFKILISFPTHKTLLYIITLLIVLSIWIGWGNYRLHNLKLIEDDFNASIVQVSIPQYIKWDEAFYDSTLALYREYTLKAAEEEPDLIILPESAIPDYVLNFSRPLTYVKNLVRDTGIDLFLGLPHYEIDSDSGEYEYKFYNATTLFYKDGRIHQPYYKIILVPVGERIPFMDYIPPLRNLQLGQANWEYGEDLVHFEVQKEDKKYRFSSLICFEIAFPHLTSQLAADDVDFMVNVTNDAWFKKTVGPYQHGMMTVIRAVETRTQIYRAANTGISMIVDPRGVIRQRTRLYEQTVINDKLYLYPEQTIYVRYMRNYPALFVFLSSLLFIITILCGISIKRT
ncbi:MAG: apolipoprotein N-acyltransferase [Candidatus Cloacimonetes bacterium]|nr:apolipoprotein N-acyltransferase [Candidatus Cloacimonadota bacterium]